MLSYIVVDNFSCYKKDIIMVSILIPRGLAMIIVLCVVVTVELSGEVDTKLAAKLQTLFLIMQL